MWYLYGLYVLFLFGCLILKVCINIILLVSCYVCFNFILNFLGLVEGFCDIKIYEFVLKCVVELNIKYNLYFVLLVLDF